MKFSYKGIGESAATFGVASGNTIALGEVAKVSANSTISACASGDKFAGVVLARHGNCAAMQFYGIATVACSGTAPAPGFVSLVADGNGGVKAGSGREYLVIAAENNTVTIVL